VTTFPHSFWWFVVDALAVARLSRLIAYDTITRSLRLWAAGARPSGNPQRPRLAAWLSCPWCLSPYLAAGVLAATAYIAGVWQWVAAGLAFSEVAGFLAEYDG